jgi:hypothetical protein
MVRASDLPDPFKKQLLANLRSQVGHQPVDHLVDQIGEDGVVDVVLQAMSSHERPTSYSSWRKGFGLLFVGGIWPPIYLVFSVIGSLGWVGVPVCLGIAFLIVAVGALVDQIGIWNATSAALAWTLGGACVVALLIGVGFALWIGLPWIGSGIWQWWHWLGGHFT